MRSQSLLQTRRGAVSVVFAAGAVSLLCLTGVVFDGGNVDTATRSLQGATDLAAISAASDLANATAAADATAVSNAYQPNDVSLVELGIYTPDPSLPPAARFVPGAAQTANAARVTMTHLQPLVFADIFRLQAGANAASVSGQAQIVTQAIAASTRTVSYAIGSGVAAFNGGIVNAVLSATLGAQVSLSAVDYQSLASAQVDLFALAKAVSAEVGPVGASYGQATGRTISTEQFLQALATAAPASAPVLQTLASQAGLSANTVDLSKLLSFGPYANQLVSDPEPQVTATASVLSLVEAAAEVGGEPHVITISSFGPNIPGITSVSGMITLGEPAQGTTVFGVSAAGSSVHTSQLRLYLDVVLAGSVDGGVVNLPLYLEVGYGTAALGALSCNALDSSQTQATLNVTPGLINGWIGNVTAANMTNYTAEPQPTPATLLNLASLVTVTGTANATVGDISPVPVQFSATDIQNVAVKTTSTTDFIGALVSSLVGNAQLKVNVLGIGAAVPPGLTQAVSAALLPAASPVDQLITTILQTTGVGVGQASTWISGARCNAALLAG